MAILLMAFDKTDQPPYLHEALTQYQDTLHDLCHINQLFRHAIDLLMQHKNIG
jgi:hypothetical protein